MPTFASQDITVTTTPVSFDKNILNKKPATQAAVASFVVENAKIRMTADPRKIPTSTSGKPGDVGQSVVVSDEADIRNFKTVVEDPTKTAFISVEFSTKEND